MLLRLYGSEDLGGSNLASDDLAEGACVGGSAAALQGSRTGSRKYTNTMHASLGIGGNTTAVAPNHARQALGFCLGLAQVQVAALGTLRCWSYAAAKNGEVELGTEIEDCTARMTCGGERPVLEQADATGVL